MQNTFDSVKEYEQYVKDTEGAAAKEAAKKPVPKKPAPAKAVK